MKHHYNDIRSRIPDPPVWWDENGCPRYDKFTPDSTADIYASEAVLLRIACQDCGTEFDVCMSYHVYLKLYRPHARSLSDAVKDGTIHYGDPPNIGCCAAGASMNCIDLRVLEYWKREKCEWKRVPELEIELPDAKTPP